MKNIRDVFIVNLKRIMRENNITQSDISSKIGIPLSTVSSWYNGQSYPRVDKMQKLADCLNVSMMDLIVELPFSIRLKYALDYRNKKPVDLANATGLSQSIISQYLSGGFMPKYDNLRRIADYLNVSVDYLNGSSNDINDTSSQLSNDDQDILNLFHMLSDENKSFVISMMKKLINN